MVKKLLYYFQKGKKSLIPLHFNREMIEINLGYVKTIVCFKKLILALSEFSNSVNDPNEVQTVKEKVDELDNVCDEYKNTIKTLKIYQNEISNPFKHHPEIFFSPKEIKNFNFHKLISCGKFGKVIKYSLNFWNNVFKAIYII